MDLKPVEKPCLMELIFELILNVSNTAKSIHLLMEFL